MLRRARGRGKGMSQERAIQAINPNSLASLTQETDFPSSFRMHRIWRPTGTVWGLFGLHLVFGKLTKAPFSCAFGTPLRPAETSRSHPTATSCYAHGLLDAYAAAALRPYYLSTCISSSIGDVARSGPPRTTRVTARACASGKRDHHQARARGSCLPAHALLD